MGSHGAHDTPRGGTPRGGRTWWIVSGLAVVLAIGAAVGWRLRWRPHAPAAPVVAGVPLSPEELALQRAAEASPRDPEPWRKLGELYLVQLQPFEAIWSFQEALERRPGDVPAELRLAEALEAAELYRPALATLSEVLRRTPENLDARERLARLSLRVGEAEPAITALRGTGPRLASWPEGLRELGRARQLAGDLPGAVATYRRLLDASPGDPEGTIRLARTLLEQGQLDPARRVLEHGRLSAPHDPRFPFYLGLSWVQEGHPQKPDRAMDLFKEALFVAPKHPLPHHYMGLLLARQGRWPEAQVHFLQATQADPTYSEPQRELARSFEKTGDLAQAKEQLGVYYFLLDDPYQAAEAFRAMVKAAPANVQAPRLVSLAYLRLGRNDWAIRETKAALQRHPGDVTLLERLATLYIMTHSRPAARRTCEEWLKIAPGAPRAHWLLGRIAQDDLKVPQAIREFEAAVAGDPANPEYAAALAGALNDAGGQASLRRATSLLQQAVLRDPKAASYRHDLGMTLQQLGDLEGARRQFLAALDLNPRHAPSFSGISQLCVRLRKPALAAFFGPLVRAAQDRSREELRLSRRLGQNPTSPEAHTAMAEFLIRSAAFPTAQAHLERALALRPGYPPAKAALVHVKRAISIR
jgi:tetratricopeptide (TPR) repeat protein